MVQGSWNLGKESSVSNSRKCKWCWDLYKDVTDIPKAGQDNPAGTLSPSPHRSLYDPTAPRPYKEIPTGEKALRGSRDHRVIPTTEQEPLHHGSLGSIPEYLCTQGAVSSLAAQVCPGAPGIPYSRAAPNPTALLLPALSPCAASLCKKNIPRTAKPTLLATTLCTIPQTQLKYFIVFHA